MHLIDMHLIDWIVVFNIVYKLFCNHRIQNKQFIYKNGFVGNLSGTTLYIDSKI